MLTITITTPDIMTAAWSVVNANPGRSNSGNNFFSIDGGLNPHSFAASILVTLGVPASALVSVNAAVTDSPDMLPIYKQYNLAFDARATKTLARIQAVSSAHSARLWSDILAQQF